MSMYCIPTPQTTLIFKKFLIAFYYTVLIIFCKIHCGGFCSLPLSALDSLGGYFHALTERSTGNIATKYLFIFSEIPFHTHRRSSSVKTFLHFTLKANNNLSYLIECTRKIDSIA